MDTASSKPGLFTFAQRPPPTGTGPWEKNANLLRITGWLVVAGILLSILGLVFLLTISTAVASTSQVGAAVGGAVAVMSIVVFAIIIALYVAALWWVNYTYFHWCNRDRRGYGHCMGVAIVLVVFGGLGLLSNMGSLAFASLTGMVSLLSLLVAVAQLVLGILLLVNRNKPETQAAFGLAHAPPPPGMTN